uniref:WG repeat-containing protein n=1 Tax=uncultured Amphritea sp. TaxID=981605 RepID=UPI002606301D
VITVKYDEIGVFKEGLAKVELNGKFGFIDKNGQEIVELKYDNTEEFIEGLAAVCLNNMWGFIDKTGKMVIPAEYVITAGGLSLFKKGNLNNDKLC